jgi:flagellar export protein FliJ
LRKFKFKFDAVERVRKIETELQMKELAIALKRQERIDAEIENLSILLADEIQRARTSIDYRNSDQLSMLSVRYRDNLNQQIQEKKKELLEAKREVVAERRHLIEKSKAEQVIEKLKEKEKEKHDDEIRKEESKINDETASNFWIYRFFR